MCQIIVGPQFPNFMSLNLGCYPKMSTTICFIKILLRFHLKQNTFFSLFKSENWRDILKNITQLLISNFFLAIALWCKRKDSASFYKKIFIFKALVIFWKRTPFCWSGIFLGVQFQKIGNFGRAAKFSFSKNRRGLKYDYFFVKICRILPYTSKNNRQKENLKLKVV